MSPFDSDPVRRTDTGAPTPDVKPRQLSRLARLMTGRNSLRRPVDKIEAAVLLAVFAAFGVALVLAGIFGTHTYQVQRAATAGLRPTAAVLLQHGPAAALGHIGQAEARWSVLGSGPRPGMLTTQTAPDITGAPAGARIPIWLNRSGQLAAPPADQAIRIIYALARSPVTGHPASPRPGGQGVRPGHRGPSRRTVMPGDPHARSAAISPRISRISSARCRGLTLAMAAAGYLTELIVAALGLIPAGRHGLSRIISGNYLWSFALLMTARGLAVGGGETSEV